MPKHYNPAFPFPRFQSWFSESKQKVVNFGVFVSNFILFLSYHSDQITQPRMRLQNSRCFRFFTRLSHWMLKSLHLLWRAAERPHDCKIFVQVLQANLHEKRMWEFDSISRLQKGHAASQGSIIPFSTRKSPVFSFSRFANHTDSFALGGINFYHMMFTMGLDREGL